MHLDGMREIDGKVMVSLARRPEIPIVQWVDQGRRRSPRRLGSLPNVNNELRREHRVKSALKSSDSAFL